MLEISRTSVGVVQVIRRATQPCLQWYCQLSRVHLVFKCSAEEGNHIYDSYVFLRQDRVVQGRSTIERFLLVQEPLPSSRESVCYQSVVRSSAQDMLSCCMHRVVVGQQRGQHPIVQRGTLPYTFPQYYLPSYGEFPHLKFFAPEYN